MSTSFQSHSSSNGKPVCYADQRIIATTFVLMLAIKQQQECSDF
jgi:hypothetical protein